MCIVQSRANKMSERLKRFRGALVGTAVGDALGTTVEFSPPGSFSPLTDIVGGGPFNLLPGQWTDDTSMMLCLGESLLETRKCDLRDQLRRYVKWYREGHRSSNGRCFDIGITVRQALYRFEEDQSDGRCGNTAERSAGNGSLMRLAPVPLFAFTLASLFDEVSEENLLEHAARLSALSSVTTHGTQMCTDSCLVYGILLASAVRGDYANMEEPHKQMLQHDNILALLGEAKVDVDKLHPRVQTIVLDGSFRTDANIEGSGFVIKSMEAALWSLFGARDFKDAVLRAANLGKDADTTAAICGALAGAVFGEEGIPLEWQNKVTLLPLFQVMGDALCDPSDEHMRRFKAIAMIIDELESRINWMSYADRLVSKDNASEIVESEIEQIQQQIEDLQIESESYFADSAIPVLRDFLQRAQQAQQAVRKKRGGMCLLFASLKAKASS
ncbi:MAG: hypothetical protein MHM6MM_001820 [Cercozoa sp. M6MM]